MNEYEIDLNDQEAEDLILLAQTYGMSVPEVVDMLTYQLIEVLKENEPITKH